jgi:hypothetical protein
MAGYQSGGPQAANHGAGQDERTRDRPDGAGMAERIRDRARASELGYRGARGLIRIQSLFEVLLLRVGKAVGDFLGEVRWQPREQLVAVGRH